MAAAYAAAIDQGTTGTRFMIFGHEGQVIASAYQEYQQIYPQPGWVEHNPMEIWDVSHLHNTMRLCEEGLFDRNMVFHIDYPLGIAGGQPATPKQLMYIAEEGKKMFPNSKWQALGIGKDEYPMITLAMILGADSVRVGLEDNIYIGHGELAKSNAQLVEKAVRIAHELDFEVATVEEAREILHMKKNPKKK